MSGRRPRIVAMGGGGFSSGFDDAALDLFVMSLSARTVAPRICLLPTAGGDPEEQIARFYAFFGGRDCEPSHVSLFRLSETQLDLREHLTGQDVIYVGGGSLLNLLAIWRAHGLDAILRDAWASGVVLAGLSAGSMCWFEHGITTSHGRPSPGRGLGFLEGSNSVHWSSQPGRRHVYRDAIADGMPAGYGVDDGAALVFKGRRLHEVVASRRNAGAWHVAPGADGEVVETPLEVRRLAAPERGPRGSGLPVDIAELREVRRGAELARRHARRVG